MHSRGAVGGGEQSLALLILTIKVDLKILISLETKAHVAEISCVAGRYGMIVLLIGPGSVVDFHPNAREIPTS